MTKLVRGFALILTLAGMLATIRPSANASPRPSGATAERMPIPVCPPDDANACHIKDY